MNYSYEFTKVEPKQNFVQIRYSSDGRDDIWKNLVTGDFSEQGLHFLAESFLDSVISRWKSIDSAPSDVALEVKSKAGVFKSHVYSPEPEFDELTEKLEQAVTETETEIVHSWNVIGKTESEKSEALAQWRSTKSVSMRQARLALIQQGLLGSVNAAISQMPEPDKSLVETEWEYASVVDRNSPWIESMTVALGLTVEQMDDLFRLAITL